MLALGIRYLNGWAMAAADGAKKEIAEWPPHPDRVFMALAAAHFEGERRGSARAALEWLEDLPPPAIAASGSEQRALVTHYVPVNDDASPLYSNGKKKGKPIPELGAMALGRDRQARQFPVAIPHEDTVHLIWQDAEPTTELRSALEALCAEVTCIGHSASLVQMWVADGAHAATWVPADTRLCERQFRVPTSGRLRALEAAFDEAAQSTWIELSRAIDGATTKLAKQLKAECKQRFDDHPPVPRRPPNGFWADYAQSRPDSGATLIGNVFSPRILVFRQIAGTRLGLESSLLLMQALRDCLLKRCPVQPPPEWLSGHGADGRPSRDPHLAMFPLPHVGYRHAQGHLLGVALAVPASVVAAEIGRCLAPLLEFDDQTGLPKPFHLYAGHLFDAEYQFDLADDPPRALQPETWVGPRGGARTWASVTPIVLDRHGKSANPWEDAQATVAQACERAGLPRPAHIVLGPVSHFVGAPSAGCKRGGYPHLLRKEGGRRHHVHAVLTFPQEVRGPVLVGAGRFRGYGLCRPWPPLGGFEP